MPYLQNEIAQAQAKLAAAERELADATARLGELSRARDASVAQLTALRQRVADLTGQRDNLSAELARLNSDLAVTLAEADAAQRTVNDLEQRISNLEVNQPQPPEPEPDRKPPFSPAAWREYLEALAAWQAQLDQLRQARDEAAAQVVTLRQRVGQIISERDRRSAELEGINAELASAQANVDAAQRGLNEFGAKLEQARQVQNTALARADTARASIIQLTNLSNEVDREPMNRRELESAAAVLGARLEELRQAIEGARNQIRWNDERIKAWTAERGGKQTEIGMLNSEILRLQKEIANLSSQITAAQKERQAAEAALAAAATAINEHQLERPIAWWSGRPDPVDVKTYKELLAEWEASLEKLRQAHNQAVDRIVAAGNQLRDLPSLRNQSEAQLSALNNRVAALHAEVGALNNQVTVAQSETQAANAQIADLTPRAEEYRLARETATAALLGKLPTELPIVLLPVRLETRFSLGPNGPELLLRMYTDAHGVNTHEPGLTEEEESWGRHFWAQTAAAGTSEAQKRLAWQQLAERFGPERAAWIARSLDSASPSNVARRSGSWTRAPETSVLPDRWVAIGYRNGRPTLTAWGDPIPLEPLPVGPSPQAGAGSDPLTGNAGMRWMIDFDAAVGVGMGLRIPLTAEQADQGFERLIVVGVKAALNETASTERLKLLLDAQHYTSGLAFVPQNTPTNNTRAASSGYSSDDSDYESAYRIELGAPLIQAGDGSDGEVTARALGIEATFFAHTRFADGVEQRDSRAMNTALWYATGGPFLKQMQAIAPSDAAITQVRQHFIDYVRGRGPLPALRIGNQPYGLLPVTSFDRWAASDSDIESPIVESLRALQNTWRGLGVQAPRAGRGADMITLLMQEATSCSYVVRSFQENASISGLLTLPRPPVQPNNRTDEGLLEPNYIQLLRESSLAAIDAETYPQWPGAKNAPRPQPLLYLLLRHAALQLLGNAAPDPERDAFLQSLDYLKLRPAGALRSLTAETLDLCSYRIDAWVTSLATRRLEQLRQRKPEGIRLGGYGWVEDLVPRKGGGAPAGSEGFVQAPSLAHAATAAVLRSGYLTHKQNSCPPRA